jgi:hypothetical protein
MAGYGSPYSAPGLLIFDTARSITLRIEENVKEVKFK